jgi:NAD+ synthase
MNPEVVSKEIGDFVIENLEKFNSSGCVIGLSGGIDSTTTAALIKKAFDEYNEKNGLTFELVGYMLPSKINDPSDLTDAIKVAELLGIRYEIHDISGIVEAYWKTNFNAVLSNYHRGNLTARVRANVLSSKSATERKTLAGTGNWDEDFGLGYYTLFGDGAVHMSPIGGLPKRLVREMADYLGMPEEIVNREPTAGLEPGQTDFKDIGYSYGVAELVIMGYKQGISPERLRFHPQVTEMVEKEIYSQKDPKFTNTTDIVYDIMKRHMGAKAKAKIIHPPTPRISLEYR